MSMRKALKRCKGHKLTFSNSDLSTDAEMNQNVFNTIADPSDSFDKSAFAALQPRSQP